MFLYWFDSAIIFIFGVYVQIRSVTGFTLTELLISVLIVAVLGSLAMPSYIEYVQDSRRSDAQQKMLQLAVTLERIYSRNGGYPDTTSFNVTLVSEGYNFKYVNSDKPAEAGDFRSRGFTLSAIPKSSGPQVTDRCGKLTLDQKGDKKALIGEQEVMGCW